ncbi:transcription factor MYB33-like [Impatiens glandulifera]|uniref:transcription factor MYB33-like n=1 Tax=Impatiens glandulifera TaxID=253017 RepID=UPI001FB0E8D4|nr:transcription factor MYB33-like [Impatiens glandulifera]
MSTKETKRRRVTIENLSLSNEESNNNGENGELKKGPWTTAEDNVLLEYVEKYGKKNWNNVQKMTGLSRCGKSCRLRWLNHLKPNLIKFAITPEEEKRIVELHYQIGSKWSRMASELPGRTDNDIKNFWNTRLKRLQRLGQPIYPPEICKAVQKSEQTENKSTIMSGYGSRRYPFHLPAGVVYTDIPTMKFDGLKNNSHPPDYPNVLSFSVPPFGSSNQGLPISQPAKVFNESVAGYNNIPYSSSVQHMNNGNLPSSYINQSQPWPIMYNCVNPISNVHSYPFSSPRLDVLASNKSELSSLQYIDPPIDGKWEKPLSPNPSFDSIDDVVIPFQTREFNSDDPTGIRRESECMEMCYPTGQGQGQQQKLMPTNSIFDNYKFEDYRPLDLTLLSSCQSTHIGGGMIEIIPELDNVVIDGIKLSDL